MYSPKKHQILIQNKVSCFRGLKISNEKGLFKWHWFGKKIGKLDLFCILFSKIGRIILHNPLVFFEPFWSLTLFVSIKCKMDGINTSSNPAKNLEVNKSSEIQPRHSWVKHPDSSEYETIEIIFSNS